MATWADALFNVPPPKRKYKQRKRLVRYGKCLRCGKSGVYDMRTRLVEIENALLVPHVCNEALPKETI